MQGSDLIERKTNAPLGDQAALLDLLPHAVLVASQDGAVRHANMQWERLTGRAAGAAQGMMWLDALDDEDRPVISKAWAELRTTETAGHAEARIRTCDGGSRVCLVRFVPVAMPQRGWIITLTDVSDIAASRSRESSRVIMLEERLAERTRSLVDAAVELDGEIKRREAIQSSLLQAQKLEALGQLTGGVAHDFNNVLAAVIGSFELIRRRTGSPEILELIRRGEQAATRAARLIKQLLAFSRRGDLKPEVLDVLHVLRNADDLICHAVGAQTRCVLDLPDSVWPVLADPNELEIAILNLAVNARDAMPDGGTLTVSARNVPEGECPPDLRPGAYVGIVVSDTGQGMTPETLARATEPFFTTKAPGKGTGLGLPMVHGFAAQSGGTLVIDSRVGAGTRIEIILPRAAFTNETLDGAGPAQAGSRHGGATLLLVDDDDHLRPITTASLRDLGYTVIAAASAEAAMAGLHTADRIDLLITDITMPGMQGPELAARIQAERPDIPVLFITASAGETPAGPVLRKPFTDYALAAAILECLGRHPKPPAGMAGRIIARVRTPCLRAICQSWMAARRPGEMLPRMNSVDPAAFGVGEDSFLVHVDLTGDTPGFTYVRMGAALLCRLDQGLSPGSFHPDRLTGDESLGQLAGAYYRAAKTLEPVYQSARYDFGDGAPAYFERLLLPLTDDGRRFSHLLGVALFGPQDVPHQESSR